MNTTEIIITAVLTVLLVLTCAKLIRDRKNGKKSCPSSAFCTGDCASCQQKQNAVKGENNESKKAEK